MTGRIAMINTGPTLKSGWQYLFVGWAVIAALVIASIVFGKLFPGHDIRPYMNGPANIIMIYIVAGFIIAIPAGFLLAAIVMAIKSMANKRGGLALLLTTVFGTWGAFVLGTLVLFVLNSSH